MDFSQRPINRLIKGAMYSPTQDFIEGLVFTDGDGIIDDPEGYSKHDYFDDGGIYYGNDTHGIGLAEEAEYK